MKSSKAQLLRSTLLAALAVPGMAIPAFAQETTGPAAQPTEAEERDVVVVTGSRIARQDFVANSPIVTMDVEDIQATGVSTLDTLLNTMPQFVPGINMTSNNPSNGGQSNLQLRGLGSNRTLVLMNGRRVVPSTSGGSVDVNVLPSQLVSNIETITGGASATYGSDAMAGVINFILRDNFEGFEVSGTIGETDRGDGRNETISMATGGAFADGNGNAMLMVSYNRRDDIYNGTREFSSISGPSGASPLGNTVFDSTNLPTNIGTFVPGAAASDTFGFNNDGTLYGYVLRRDFQSPGGIDYDGFAQPGPFFNANFAYNTGALNLLTLPQTRYNAFATVDYTINENFEVYTDFLFTQYESYQELAASPAAATTGWRVPVSNPFITPELAAVLASRPTPLASFRLDKRFSALGPRRGAEQYDVYQITSGVRGEMGFGDWTYDLYGSYGRVDRVTTQTGNVSRSAVQQLLNAADGGNALCAGGFDWFGETTLSNACKAFVGRTAKNLGINEQRNVEFSMQGGLFTLPAGEIRTAVGVSYREDTFNFIPDGSLTGPITTQPCIATAAYPGTGPNLVGACAGSASAATSATGNPPIGGNDIAGFNPSGALAGATDVIEGFAEVLIPIVKDVPFIDELNLTLAGRTSDYSTVGSLQTYKADIDWTVVEGVRVRGGVQQATRAPSIGELFAPVLLGFPNIGTPQTTAGVPQKSGDPCDIRSGYRSTAGSNLAAPTNAQVRALCIAQGVNAAVIDTYTFTNQQIPGFSGGNATLSEETANSYSVGVVWQPSFEQPWLANLSASVDYYSIELEDAIGTVDANTMIQQCYNANGTSNPTYDPNNFFCQLFNRDPLAGSMQNAISTNQNLATAKTSGVDVQVDWAMDIGPGTLDVSWVGAWLEKFDQQNLPGGAFISLAGTIGNTGPLGQSVAATMPEWKWMLSTNYRMGPYRIGARWQHIDEMVNRNASTDSIPAIGYFDLLGAWDITDNLTLRANINNVLDEQPPTYSPSVQANTDPSTYDVLGRRYSIGFTARF
jgi:outer membrane receptor protein involved in Fe transport